MFNAGIIAARRQEAPVVVIKLSGREVEFEPQGGDGIYGTTVSLEADGRLYLSGIGYIAGEWAQNLPAGGGSMYEMSIGGGGWQSLSVGRTTGVSAYADGNPVTFSANIRIRDASTLVILADATFTGYFNGWG